MLLAHQRKYIRGGRRRLRGSTVGQDDIFLSSSRTKIVMFRLKVGLSPVKHIPLLFLLCKGQKSQLHFNPLLEEECRKNILFL
jgi:hypothetical protein